MRKKMLFNYKKGIHPECGKKIKVYKDILMTPFYTENFCDELVKMSKEYKDKFSPDIVYGKSDSHKMTEDYPWDTLFFSKISYFLFEDFCEHYKKFICPILHSYFSPCNVAGWFSPMIIKYSRVNQKVDIHNDTSLFTLNVKLNTDFEGCELEFPRQEWNNSALPKGWCMVWPSQVTHPHRARPLLKGTKYTLASWTHPISWNSEQMGGSIYNDRENA
tara:strand:+ start:4797 stop:5450 length:654 start_codon:yes stop_codon:yes gene_type:complete